MTYGEIYRQFESVTNINKSLVSDYRPCCELFDVPNIPNAIIVWLKTGDKIIYIAKGETI